MQADPTLTADASSYTLPADGSGDVAKLLFQNPWGLGSALLVLSSSTGYIGLEEFQVREIEGRSLVRRRSEMDAGQR